jgi:hypothetical protein
MNISLSLLLWHNLLSWDMKDIMFIVINNTISQVVKASYMFLKFSQLFVSVCTTQSQFHLENAQTYR